MPSASVITGPNCGLSLAAVASLILHGCAIAAALAWWHVDHRQAAPAIAVDLVAPQTMPPPARITAREAVAMPRRTPMVADVREAFPRSVPTESVTPATDPVPLPKAVPPPEIQPESGGLALAPPTQRPEVSLNLVSVVQTVPEVSLNLVGAVPPVPGANPAPPDAPSKSVTMLAALTPITHNAPRFDGGDLANQQPRYPYVARWRGQQGRVVLRVLVSAKGHAKSVSIRRSSGYRLLDEAALKTVRTWRFAPARRADIPVPGAVEVPVSFRLTK